MVRVLEELIYKTIKKNILKKDTKTQRKIISKLNPRLAHKVLYYTITKKELNLDNPHNFNEKLHYMMLYVHGELETTLADKYEVRNYVQSKGYGNILTKLYGIFNSVEEIDINKLPKSFVLKCNHGCGNIQFCENKNSFNFASAKKILKDTLDKDFSTQSLEPHYHNIKRKIICEEFLPHKQGQLPNDYKFYCFNGKVDCILLCTEREKKYRMDYYDLDWNYLPYAKAEYRSNKKHQKPKNLAKMVRIAEVLSEGFPFVRVDLYNINGEIYFQEMTFTPAAGQTDRNTEEALNYFGDLLILPPKQHDPLNISLSY